MGKPFDAELKAAFLAAVKVHLAKGWTTNSAYMQAKADFMAEEKPVPDKKSCYHWLAAEKNAGSVNRPSSPSGPAIAEEPEADDAQEEAAPEMDDYTRRLELMVLLYRRRSDSDCDAVCDRLLPELTEEEE